jgi:hypothetical protein
MLLLRLKPYETVLFTLFIEDPTLCKGSTKYKRDNVKQ